MVEKINYLYQEKNIQDRIKAKVDKYVFEKVAKKIKSRLSNTSSNKYLEFGPGTGKKFDIIEDSICKFEHVVFVDFDPRILEFLKGKYGDNRFSYINVSADAEIKLKEEFDLILSSHVIEHLQSPSQHLTNIYKFLKKSGVAYLGTPNLESLNAKNNGLKWRGYSDPTHISLLGISQLVELCEQAMLKIDLSGTSLCKESFTELLEFIFDQEFTFRNSGRGDACSLILKK